MSSRMERAGHPVTNDMSGEPEEKNINEESSRTCQPLTNDMSGEPVSIDLTEDQDETSTQISSIELDSPNVRFGSYECYTEDKVLLTEGEVHNIITLSPGKIYQDEQHAIKLISESRNLMEELSCEKRANILKTVVPKKVKGRQRGVKRLHNTKRKDDSISTKGTDEVILVYPPPPAKGIIIHKIDYIHLSRKKYLPDNIIEFYLNYFWNNVLSEEDRQRTYIFSPNFYVALASTTNDANKVSLQENQITAEAWHERLKIWTKHVDIFDKDFVIVPVCANFHWIVAIICLPGLSKSLRTSGNTPLSEDEGDTRTGGGDLLQNYDLQQILKDWESDEENTETISPVSKVKPSLKPIQQPCILLFDSLPGIIKTAEVGKTLKEYIKIEWKMRRGPSDPLSTTQVIVPIVPLQPNGVDCGIYLLQYVETFFKKPIMDFREPIRLNHWFTTQEAARKRRGIMKIIKLLIKKTMKS